MRIDVRTRGKDHPQYIRHLHNLATALHERATWMPPSRCIREAVALFRQVLGPEHSRNAATRAAISADCWMDRGRFDEAQQIYATALAASRKAHPEPHVDVANLLSDLGRLALARKQYAEAEQRLREALQIYRATLPPGHGYTAAALTNLGRTLLELNRAQDAEDTLQSALDEWSKEFGTASPWYALARAFLGRAWAMQGRFAEAEPALLETYPLLLRARMDDHHTASVRRWIEELYRSTGRPQQAQAYFRQVQAQERAARTP